MKLSNGLECVIPFHLNTLTDEKLEKYGLMQLGLRKAVLAVIENV